MLYPGLKLLVVAAALIAIGGLTLTIRSSLRFGPRKGFAPPFGSERQGIQYALFAGMMPWAKESTRRHLITWCVGVIYHIAIAAGFAVLVITLLSIEVMPSVQVVLMALLFAGIAAGVGLLAKRTFTLTLRAITTPDDIISNTLVTVFLAFAAAAVASTTAKPALLVSSALLLCYIPVGKIRHCLLFFFSRVTFGRFFGRRGVLPHQSAEVNELHVNR